MRLKELRKQKKATQIELSKLLNITQVTYGRYELETSEPNIETLCKLADYYNVSIDYLIGRENINEIGYLNEQQINAVKLIKELNPVNLLQAIGYISGLLTAQN